MIITRGYLTDYIIPRGYVPPLYTPVTGETISIISYISSMVFNKANITKDKDLNFSLSNTISRKSGVWIG